MNIDESVRDSSVVNLIVSLSIILTCIAWGEVVHWN